MRVGKDGKFDHDVMWARRFRIKKKHVTFAFILRSKNQLTNHQVISPGPQFVTSAAIVYNYLLR